MSYPFHQQQQTLYAGPIVHQKRRRSKKVRKKKAYIARQSHYQNQKLPLAYPGFPPSHSVATQPQAYIPGYPQPAYVAYRQPMQHPFVPQVQPTFYPVQPIGQQYRGQVRRYQEVVGSDSDGQQSVESDRKKSKRKCSSASSIFKGVSWHKRDKCYMARVWVDGTSKHIGSYQEEMRAAIAVDERLERMGKDESFMNYPSKLEREIVLSILKHKRIPDDVSDLSLEELKDKDLDRNGFPNSISPILTNILKVQVERQKTMYTRKVKKKTIEKANSWDTFVEIASKEAEFNTKD